MKGSLGFRMAKVEKNRNVISRRAMLHVAAAGGATALGAGQSNPVLSCGLIRVAPEALHLRQNRVKVAAVQMDRKPFDASRPDAVVARMFQAVDSIHQQVDRIDLVSFHSGILPALDIPGTQTERLRACARKFNCYLTYGTRDLGDLNLVSAGAASILIDPSGNIHCAGQSATDIIATEIGNVALVHGPMTPEALKELATDGAEILIGSVPAGYPVEALQAASTSTQVYSVVVTEARSLSDPSLAATAIIDCKGKIMTRTGSCWTQTVVATLPIASLRANRDA